MHSALIIDDDVWMQRIMLKNLKQYGFDEIYTASDGFNGIALAVEHIPSLIVLDILMRELDGVAVLKILKAIKITRDIPVLVGSGVTDVDIIAQVVKAGSSHFISKPYSKATLEEKLRDVFGIEKLELLKNHKPFSDKELGYIPEEKYKRTSTEKDDKKIDIKEASSGLSGYAAKHYSEDEKKNINALKKLLLKEDK
ncbi:MAG: response regulator [Candidatus Kapaibacterium sp.]|nr:response regulator [Ignavibacteriota bacterium]